MQKNTRARHVASRRGSDVAHRRRTRRRRGGSDDRRVAVVGLRLHEMAAELDVGRDVAAAAAALNQLSPFCSAWRILSFMQQHVAMQEAAAAKARGDGHDNA